MRCLASASRYHFLQILLSVFLLSLTAAQAEDFILKNKELIIQKAEEGDRYYQGILGGMYFGGLITGRYGVPS